MIYNRTERELLKTSPELEEYFKFLKENYKDNSVMCEEKIIEIAYLLRYIGKSLDDSDNSSFTSFGVFTAIEYLNKMDLTNKEKVKILELIQRQNDCLNYSYDMIQNLYNQKDFDDALKLKRCSIFSKRDIVFKDIQDLNTASRLDIKHKSLRNLKCLPICTLFVGPPCSGKSTHVNKLTKRVLCRDDILQELYPRETYSESWEAADQTRVNIEFYKTLDRYIFDKKDFIVDMTNCSVILRKDIISRCKDTFNFNAVVFIVPYNELLKRNKKRKDKVLDESIIKKFCSKFQMIYPGEGIRQVEYRF